ncbi:MAG: hypothetical protein HQL75_15590 [Magnetococcales bacterium]|nr:hypothetical protein [Magnetococcales bacterium]
MGDELLFVSFGSEDPFIEVFSPTGKEEQLSPQARYIHTYIKHLGVKSCIIEKNYPDWDWIAQYSQYYYKGINNPNKSCTRLHFFSEIITQDLFQKALLGKDGQESREELQKHYCGFVVKRPILESLGRTVLKLHAISDEKEAKNRVVRTVKRNEVHIAGITLYISGIPWHQKDKTGGCATVAVWTALQGSPYRDFSFSSTPDITKDALAHAENRGSIFPNTHLSLANVQTAIQAHRGLKPMTIDGNIKRQENGKEVILGFSLDKFKLYSSTYLAAGFPVILFCRFDNDKNEKYHCNCMIGFKESPVEIGDGQGGYELFVSQDVAIEHVYLNDDVVGPMGSFKIVEKQVPGENRPLTELVLQAHGEMDPKKSELEFGKSGLKRSDLVPIHMVVALPSEITVTFDQLLQAAYEKGFAISAWDYVNSKANSTKAPRYTIITAARFVSQSGFFQEGLEKILGTDNSVLGPLRLELGLNVPALSRFIGLVRVAIVETSPSSNPRPLLDLLYDSTCVEMRCIATIRYHEFISDEVIKFIQKHSNEIVVRANNPKKWDHPIVFTDIPHDLGSFGVLIKGFL